MRYKVIAEHIIDDIQQNRLALGSKMPSLRSLAKSQETSMTTAVSAYRLLEERGWIIAKPQSGFYVSSPRSLRAVPAMPQFTGRIKTVAPSETATQAVAHFRQFGLAQIGIQHIPIEAMQRTLRRSVQKAPQSLHDYPLVQGEQSLRNALSLHLNDYGLATSADELVITNGCMNSIFYALQVCTQAGDCVAISSPCFSSMLALLAQMGRKVVEIPCTQEGIDIDQLEQLIHKGTVQAALLSTNHINPLGISLSVAQKQRLAALANTYQFPVIEDDVFLELAHGKDTPLPAKYWDKSGDILWCGSFSKTLSAAMRVGWCAAGKYQNKIIELLTHSQAGVSTTQQVTLAAFIDSGQYRSHIAKTRTFLALTVERYRRFLIEHLPSTTRVSNPVGGLVLWLQIPNLNKEKLQQQLLEEFIDIRLGEEFTSLDLYRDYLRINCGWPLEGETEQKLKTVCAAIRACIS